MCRILDNFPSRKRSVERQTPFSRSEIAAAFLCSACKVPAKSARARNRHSTSTEVTVTKVQFPLNPLGFFLQERRGEPTDPGSGTGCEVE